MRGIAFFIAILLVIYDIVKLQEPEHAQRAVHSMIRYQKKHEEQKK